MAAVADNVGEPGESFRLAPGSPQASGDRLVLVGDNAVASPWTTTRRTDRPRAPQWPSPHGGGPTKKLVTVRVAGGSDLGAIRWRSPSTTLTQDEPVNGLADGDTTLDAGPARPPPDQAQIRAERSGKGDGRVYRLAVTGMDRRRRSCTTVVTVGLPHQQKGRAVDSGGQFDSVGSGRAGPADRAPP